jgi:hypothetical protein
MQAVRNSSRGSSLLYSSSATLPTTSQLPSTALLPSGATQVVQPSPRGVGISKTPMGSTSTLGFGSGDDVTLKPVRGPLPAPVAPDAPKRNNERTARLSNSRMPSTDYGDFDDLVELSEDDETIEQAKRASTTYGSFEDSLDLDDDEMIELSKRVESAAHPGKSPPSRARKLNIRDTHEHDDYGGALLSEEERKLLGTSQPLLSGFGSKLTLDRRHKDTTGCPQTDRAHDFPSTYHGPHIALRGLQYKCAPHLLPCR